MVAEAAVAEEVVEAVDMAVKVTLVGEHAVEETATEIDGKL